GSDSTRVVAKAAPGSLLWNHGAAADDVQRLPAVVSVGSHASRYLIALGRAVAALRPSASLALVTASRTLPPLSPAGIQQGRPGARTPDRRSLLLRRCPGACRREPRRRDSRLRPAPGGTRAPAPTSIPSPLRPAGRCVACACCLPRPSRQRSGRDPCPGAVS